ncbi:MAG: hypothetical protein QOE60_454 [Thermoleophilaceae bacterium]|jgi:hypothetical protein|nr:hypothetical protein [Thermoleophilaceae bacterium]
MGLWFGTPNVDLSVYGGEGLTNEIQEEIRQRCQAGAVHVSVDFTAGRLATRDDSRDAWTGAWLRPRHGELDGDRLALE